MIWYTCDMCGLKLEPDDTTHVIKEFPRRVQHWATSNNNVKILAFTRYETAETHLCNDCFCKLANALAIIE